MLSRNTLFVALIGLMACHSSPDPQRIIDAAIENHGGEAYQSVRISFDFRDRHYVIIHDGERFQYERHFSDSTGNIRDVLTNQGFQRYLNEQGITDTVKKAPAYARSVNSVAYFALLPYKLNDPAVKKAYLGEAVVNSRSYHMIEVTFQEEGGGEDHQDRFVYWIDTENLTMEYLAYRYYTDGGGLRFRAPYNIRTVGGIRFSDYENYRESDPEIPLEDYHLLYQEDYLKLLSRIELENIKVEPL